MPPGMTAAMVMPRTDPGFNHVELDEVHTPSRYFASAFISWEVHCAFGVSHFLFPTMLRIESCFPLFILETLARRLSGPASQLATRDCALKNLFWTLAKSQPGCQERLDSICRGLPWTQGPVDPWIALNPRTRLVRVKDTEQTDESRRLDGLLL